MSSSGQPQRPRIVQIVTASISASCLLRGQLEFMQRNGFDVTVIASPGPMLDETSRREGVKCIGVRMHRQPRILADLRSLWCLTKAIREIDPHVVQYSTPKAGLLGSIAALITRTPVRIYTLRGMRADGLTGLASRLLRLLEMIPCGCAHKVICVSQSLRKRAVELKIADTSKLMVLEPQSSNGVDPVRFEPTRTNAIKGSDLRRELGIPDAATVIGFVGRLCRDKGGVELLEAFLSLKREHADVHLLCVGPDEMGNRMPKWFEPMIRDEEDIHITGMMSDTVPAYAAMDILALPTYREGFPNVALEAAAMEVPVVATAVTGCVDAVADGVTGKLIPPRDSMALSNALEEYIKFPNLRNTHGEAGRRRVLESFDQFQLWTAMKELYLELLISRKVSRRVPATNSEYGIRATTDIPQ